MSLRANSRLRCIWLGVVFGLSVVVGVSVSGGVASAAAPAWKLTTVAVPTVMPAGTETKEQQDAQYDVVLENVGAAASEGEVTLRDRLPAGVTVSKLWGQRGNGEPQGEQLACEGEGSGEAVCRFDGSVVSSGFVVMRVFVRASVAVGDVLRDVASVSGGGAAPVVKEVSTRVGVEGEKAPAGISEFGFDVTGPAGEPVQQAGGHPSLVTVTALFNNMLASDVLQGNSGEPIWPVEAPRDLVFYLPLGFLGDPQVAPRCPTSLINAANPAGPVLGECPPDSRVGTVYPQVLSFAGATYPDLTGERPLYNVKPEHGYAAEFAFEADNFVFYSYANVVRRAGTYMLRVAMPGTAEFTALVAVVASFYGDSREQYSVGGAELSRDLGAFLTNPSACSEGPLEASLEMNTWEHPATSITQSATAYSGIEGCGHLGFSTVLGARPSSTQADEPTGYTVGVQAPQAQDSFSGLASPPYKSVSVTLPAGTSLSPAGANGLGACQETGVEGIDIEGGESEGVAADGLPRPVAGHCPVSSRIASVRASSPLLGEELTGHMFLAAPRCGGSGQPGCTAQDAQDGSLFGLYIELEAPGAGVVVKLRGRAMVDPTTGRVRTVFEGIPQFPVSNLVVETNGGPRAPLANPQACGTGITTSDVTPWSAPVTPDAINSSSFGVDWDGNGGACPAGMPFSPGFSAGTVSPVAGGFSAFTMTLARHDREQDLSGVSVTLPPGVLGILKDIPLCGEPQAAQGTCGAGSQIGTTEVAAGAGSEPLWIAGRVYLTVGYRGAPFGLSIVVPAEAGPFHLGNVVVRAGVSVDPHTAQITVASDPFPQLVDGIPLRLQTVNVTVNREGFTFNATNCDTQRVTGTVSSAQGASVGVASPYNASGCKTLPFKPVFTVSTQAATSKKNGASLVVKAGYPAGSANIRSVAVTLPVQLPARLTTIQQACTEAVFNANPASCPAGSNIGTATASTPIFANPLSGPVYLVSHGGAAFPDIVVILQGEGVTVDLTGSIDIKHNVTSSTFASVPDAPIGSFTLMLPEGPHSGLGPNLPAKAKGSFCGQSLTMPTTITGQNGAVVKQSTKVAVSGCPRAKKKTVKKHARSARVKRARG
jgi:hypothetical protein